MEEHGISEGDESASAEKVVSLAALCDTCGGYLVKSRVWMSMGFPYYLKAEKILKSDILDDEFVSYNMIKRIRVSFHDQCEA